MQKRGLKKELPPINISNTKENFLIQIENSLAQDKKAKKQLKYITNFAEYMNDNYTVPH